MTLPGVFLALMTRHGFRSRFNNISRTKTRPESTHAPHERADSHKSAVSFRVLNYRHILFALL